MQVPVSSANHSRLCKCTAMHCCKQRFYGLHHLIPGFVSKWEIYPKFMANGVTRNIRNELEISSHVILGFQFLKQPHLSLPFDLQLKSCKGDHRAFQCSHHRMLWTLPDRTLQDDCAVRTWFSEIIHCIWSQRLYFIGCCILLWIVFSWFFLGFWPILQSHNTLFIASGLLVKSTPCGHCLALVLF